MKRCPTCHRTYPDGAPPCCSEDGTRLIDPQPVGQAPTVAALNQSGSQNFSQPTWSPPQPPPPAYQQTPSAYQPQPRGTRLFGALAMVFSSFALVFLIYLLSQIVMRDYTFRTMWMSVLLVRFGLSLFLGFGSMGLSVVIGIIAVVLSFRNPQRYRGRVLGIVAPVLSIMVAILVVLAFAFRRFQGPPSYYSTYTPSTYQPSYTPSPTPYSSASMTDEEKYRLFYAATKADDQFLLSEAGKKIGIVDSKGRPTSSYSTFIKGSVNWAMTDTTFIRSVDTPEKARQYVNAHMTY